MHDDILYKLRTSCRMPNLILTEDHLKNYVLLELEAPINNKQVLLFLKPLTVQRMMSSQGVTTIVVACLPFGGKSWPHLDLFFFLSIEAWRCLSKTLTKTHFTHPFVLEFAAFGYRQRSMVKQVVLIA